MDVKDAKATSISTARASAIEWGRTSLTERGVRLRGLREAVVDDLQGVVDAVSADTGKVRSEALLTDVLPTLEIMLRNESLAASSLKPERRPGSLILPDARATVTREPWGTVLVIGPYNNPLQLNLLPAASALMAGNAVVVKPSEKSPHTAAVLRQLFDAADLPIGLAHVCEGGPDVARALVDERPDLIFFTGGARGGRAIMEAAAAHPIPVMLELGGKNPMLVFADADLERAAQAAVYGAFAHDGQHCVSVGRLCVHDSIHDEFASAVAEGASRLARGRDIATAVDDATAARARSSVAPALEAGARLLTGTKDGRVQLPAVLVDVTSDMAVAREETFGPVLPVMRFSDVSQATELAQLADYGLNASVWTRDLPVARRMARELASGCVFINGVLTNAGHPSLPFGGVGRSGFGRYHGPEGLRAFTRAKSVLERPGRVAPDINWFPFGDNVEDLSECLIRLRYGRKKGMFSRMAGWLRLWRLRAARLAELAGLKRLVQGGRK